MQIWTRWALVVDALEPFQLNVNENLNTKLRCDNFFVVLFFTMLIFRFSLWHPLLSFCHSQQFFLSSCLLFFFFGYLSFSSLGMISYVWFDSISYLLKWSNLNMRLFFFYLFLLHYNTGRVANKKFHWICCSFACFDMHFCLYQCWMLRHIFGDYFWR